MNKSQKYINIQLKKKNKQFYDEAWKRSSIINPSIWPHWNIIKKFKKSIFLEIGPGNKPKIPIKNNYFLDISSNAIKNLRRHGGIGYQSNLSKKLPFHDNKFDVVCAFEVLEHLLNDTFVLTEINRLLKPNGVCLLSFPLHGKLWSDYDHYCGHVRRYETIELNTFFKSAGFRIDKYASLKIPWPGKLTSKFIIFLHKLLPSFFNYISNVLDSLPFAAIRQKINLIPWTSYHTLNLLFGSTGLFLLKKDGITKNKV